MDIIMVCCSIVTGWVARSLFVNDGTKKELEGLCQVTASLVRDYGVGDVMEGRFLDSRYKLQWGTDGERVYARVDE